MEKLPIGLTLLIIYFKYIGRILRHFSTASTISTNYRYISYMYLPILASINAPAALHRENAEIQT